MSYKHWNYSTDAQQIVWLNCDRQGARTNSLDVESLNELSSILTELTAQNLRGLIIQSAKTGSFIVGADIKQFSQLKDSEQAYLILHRGQEVFSQLAACPFPTLALIRGYCLGGGLELALACRYRVAEDNPKTRLGLPEIKLGIHPGWGGTVRLPRLIGFPPALDMILKGRMVSAQEARRSGLVHTTQPTRELERAALYYILQEPKSSVSWISRFTQAQWVKALLVQFVAKKLRSTVNKEHYPAPYALLKLYQSGGDEAQALEREARSVAQLMLTGTSHELVRIFFLREQLKAQTQVKSSIQYVHVIGAGTMGGDIAAWCVLQGLQVSLQDREPRFIAPAIKRAAQLFQKHLKQSRLVQEALSRLLPDVKGVGIARADLVIEAIVENVAIKQALFKEIEPKLKPDCIIASNTSSITLTELAQSLSDPSRLIGLHFFNPVAQMPLVEVVYQAQSHADTIDRGLSFVLQIDRLPIKVKSSPGFLVNRVLMPYLLEAMLLYEEGVSVADIDAAALRFGMPMGPLALADKVGLDIGLAVGENLAQHYNHPVPARLKEWVSAGRLGCKSGHGFYHYHGGKRVDEKPKGSKMPSAELIDRLVLSMLNEAVACLREGIVSSSDLLDAAVIFGTGFAPFRGGPLEYAQKRGIDDIIARLNELSSTLGQRFTPDPGWELLKHSTQG